MPVPAALPVALPELPDLADHVIGGKATLPAVELLELLVRTVAEQAGWDGRPPLPLAMTDVSFPRFLPADEIDRCAFEVALEARDSAVRATLTSRISLVGDMRRSRVHAEATLTWEPSKGSHALPRWFATPSAGKAGGLPTRLGAPITPPLRPPADLACAFELPAARVYRELIPFGPRYCNLHGTVRLGPDGGIGSVRSPEPPRQPPPLASCPYLLDAAMHLACVWGQCYAGIVAYPTGFLARVLTKPTPAGERRCIVVPTSVEPRRLLCNLWLIDEKGEVCDAVIGLAMSPLAAGAPPPQWIVLAQDRA